MGPLTGLRVVDITSVLMGPYATQILGDFGADVIKVEAPDGDLVRQIGPTRSKGMGPMYLNVNRSKRSISLDLKQEAGREALLRLLPDADILAYNIRPQAMARLGLPADDIMRANPRLIQAAMVGHGQDGPYAARPAYDDLIQGGACLPYLSARVNGGHPAYVPSAIADRIVGLAAVNAILAAVVERDRSGEGQIVEIPMFETMVNMVMADHLGGLTFQPPLDRGGYARHLSPDRRPYATKDGHICALIYNDGHWQRFFAAIGRPDLTAGDPRYASFAARMAYIDEVYAELGEIILTRTTAEWLELFLEADIPAMQMHDFESILADPHLVAVNFFEEVEHPTEGRIRSMAVPAKFSRSGAHPSRLAPRQGEQGAEILTEVGYSADEIDALFAAGVLIAPEGQQ